MNIRILLVDDHAIMRTGLRDLLNKRKDMQVVGEVASCRQALDLLKYYYLM